MYETIPCIRQHNLLRYEAQRLAAATHVPDDPPVIVAAGLSGDETDAVVDAADRPVLLVAAERSEGLWRAGLVDGVSDESGEAIERWQP